MSYYDSYDVAVVGAGHAGIEAALAASRMGLKTILITQALEAVARMSCNPSIGGIAKGNIVKEVDALGGVMGLLTDRALIQYRLLNRSKGPAVQAPRAQADKILYSNMARNMIEKQEGLSTLMDTVVNLVVSNDNIKQKKLLALVTQRGRLIPVRSCVLTTGTFLSGKIFIGDFDAPCGRLGEMAAIGLGQNLRDLGFNVGRMKTGTPPRILKNSVDYSVLEIQEGDSEILPFSFQEGEEEIVNNRPKAPCYIAFTNQETHDIICANISHSPLYSGKITGVGPRYCPSIEDKVMRFSSRDRHQLFVEPESLYCNEIYLNGLSSSLPESVQDTFLRTIKGFEHCIVTRPGYAVEYDFVEPTQLYPTLETKLVSGLFHAGQINGTSGYEEAAGQGIVAGINAAYYAKEHKLLCPKLPLPKALPLDNACKILQEEATEKHMDIAPKYTPLVLGREEAYIGVLIDDLVTLGTKEPYRMFTARAEYRLRLRHDTADRRLTKYAVDAGLKSKTILDSINAEIEEENTILSILKKDPSVHNTGYNQRLWERALLDKKYEYYIQKEEAHIQKLKKTQKVKIPFDFDYDAIVSLSSESRQKLKAIRPMTLGQAARISGIRQSDIMLLMVYLLH